MKLFFLPCVAATSLSLLLSPHERACLYANAPAAGAKIGFYFAVQLGGSFEIGHVVRAPDGDEVSSGKADRGVDIVFAATRAGEYSFCFSNDHESFAEKSVDIDITVENEHLARPASPLTTVPTLESGLNELGKDIQTQQGLMATYLRLLRFHRTRENRSESTVETSASRLWWFSVLTTALIVLMTLGQVFIVRGLFGDKVKLVPYRRGL